MKLNKLIIVLSLKKGSQLNWDDQYLAYCTINTNTTTILQTYGFKIWQKMYTCNCKNVYMYLCKNVLYVKFVSNKLRIWITLQSAKCDVIIYTAVIGPCSNSNFTCEK